MCEHCGTNANSLVIHGNELWCRHCHDETKGQANQSTMIATDSIPGGYEVKHGLCNPDGSPRRFDSKSEIKRAAFESGWTISGDTPKVNQRLKEQREAQRERNT